MIRRPPRSTLFPYTDALPICFREGTRGARRVRIGASVQFGGTSPIRGEEDGARRGLRVGEEWGDRKSTRLNSSHANISYAVFCLKKKRIPTGQCNIC